MKNRLQEEIKNYIEGWHWDEDSKNYAFELGKFLWAFMDFIDDQKLSDRTKKDHIDNSYIIGMLESGYGFHEEFTPENLEDGPAYLFEFSRKISDSKYAIQSYKSTWRKLETFIKSEDFKKYLESVEEKLL